MGYAKLLSRCLNCPNRGNNGGVVANLLVDLTSEGVEGVGYYPDVSSGYPYITSYGSGTTGESVLGGLPGNYTGQLLTYTVRVRAICEVAAYDSSDILAGGRVAVNAPTPTTPTSCFSLTAGGNVYWLNRALNNDPDHDEGLAVLDYTFSFTASAGSSAILNLYNSDGSQQGNPVGPTNPPSVYREATDDDPSNPILVSQPTEDQFLQIDTITWA